MVFRLCILDAIFSSIVLYPWTPPPLIKSPATVIDQSKILHPIDGTYVPYIHLFEVADDDAGVPDNYGDVPWSKTSGVSPMALVKT